MARGGGQGVSEGFERRRRARGRMPFPAFLIVFVAVVGLAFWGGLKGREHLGAWFGWDGDGPVEEPPAPLPRGRMEMN